MGTRKVTHTQKILSLAGRNITLIGTAHISPESINEVVETIKSTTPDCVCIELDEKRRESMMNPDAYKEMDIVKVLKRGDGFLMMANLVLSSFQRRMGKNLGVKPGDEMMAALNTATELNIPVAMVDRSIQTTLRRAWAKNSLWGKLKLLASLVASAFDKEEVSEEQIENLKNSNEMDMMMAELADYLPKVKEVLIDERDKFLACKIWEASGANVCAVLGAGHLPGVEAHLEKIAAGTETTDTTEIDTVPQKFGVGKFIGWLIPIIIIALIVAGFLRGGRNMGSEMILQWVVFNGGLAAVGALIALGHPFAILSAIVCAPLTSLTPVVGVGIVTGIVQAIFRKPKVADMEKLHEDANSLKGWYRNRILRVMLVFVLSSLGSSIGTFVGGAGMISILAK